MLRTVENGAFLGTRILMFDGIVDNFKRLRLPTNNRFVDVAIKVVRDRTTIANIRQAYEKQYAHSELEKA
jgi:hypothetical protein